MERSHPPPGTMSNDPRPLLADEPGVALDSELGRQVIEFFAKAAHDRMQP
jgi:ABC-type lipoprotein export system ATPase subunit